MRARLAKFALAVSVVALVLAPMRDNRAQADTGWSWFKTDTHVHSTFGGDAFDDLGIIAAAAKDRGYNAVFLTDHHGGSSFPIGPVIANHVRFEDELRAWRTDHQGTLTSTTAELANSPVNTGSQSLYLASSSGGSGETFAWAKRGPNFRSGDIILKFAVYPTRIDAGSGVYISASIGGDPTIPNRPPNGYTTQAGIVSPGKSTVLVWQLGSARTASSDPNARVVTHALPYTLNTWNTYEINVTDALAEIPAADRPLDHDALTMLKMAAAANGGTAQAYFDSYSLDASAPVAPADEFVYRSTLIHGYDTSTFKIFPSYEMGINRHAQRFNFDVTNASQYVQYNQGINGILPTQQTGYPTQLNHPGLPGGVSQQEAIDTSGAGADLIEVAERSDDEDVKNVMVDTWDAILERGDVILGTWSSDMHRVERLGPATYLYAPTLDFDTLIRSLYEGRAYLALNDFGGRLVFNVDGSTTEPYPARYPIAVSDGQPRRNVHLLVTGGLSAGNTIEWIRDGVVVATDTASGTSYEATKSIDLSGPSTFVRAEVRNAAGVRLAMTEPIFFKDVASLPTPMSFHVDGVTTPSGNGYTRISVKGVTASSWNAQSKELSLTLEDPPGATVPLSFTTGLFAAEQVVLDGSPVARAASLAEFQAATAPAWYQDGAGQLLNVKLRHTNATAQATIRFTGSGDLEPPTTPAGLTAVAVGANRVDLTWSAATDAQTSVSGYTVYRDGTVIASLASGTLTYSDTSVSPATIYSYAVDAFDVAANHSATSDPAVVKTDSLAASTFSPVADSYVDSTKANSNFGQQNKLRIDGSPEIRSYLRFNLQGLVGSVRSANLRLWATSSGSGYDVRGVTNTSWDERGITFANAPPVSTSVAGSSGGFAANAWSSADVTSLVGGNGLRSLALTTPNSAAVSFASREAASAPQLVVEMVQANNAPRADDVAATGNEDTDAAWAPNVADADGDRLTCTLTTSPAHGGATVASDCSAGIYTPFGDFAGADSFTYKVNDGVLSATASVSVTVVGAPDPPLAGDLSLEMAEETAAAWTPDVFDADGDALSCRIVATPQHGAASVATSCGSGTYTPDRDFNGFDSFVYEVSDGTQTATATVNITVGGANDAPVAGNVSLATGMGTAATWQPAASDPDGDAVTCAISSPPTNGTATVAADCSSGTYTPAAGFAGRDSFSYTATDTSGAVSSPGLVDVAVNSAGRPTATNLSLSIDEDVPLTVALAASDPDGDCPLTFSVTTPPGHGVLGAIGSAQCTNGSATATVTYTPNADFNGADSFAYTASDPSGNDSAPATVSVTIVPVADAPRANDGGASTNQETSVDVTLSAFDPDGDCPLVFAATLQPLHGTLGSIGNSACTGGAATATVTYTPNPGFQGADSFRFHATDPSGRSSAAATITIAVQPVNHPPTASDRTLATDEDVAGTWTPGVSDVDGDPLTCAIAGAPAHGTAAVAADCSSGTYTPASNYAGADSFTYQVSDGAASGTATVAVTVRPVNDSPAAAGATAATAAETTVTVTLNATDVDGNCPLTFAISAPPAHGSLGAVNGAQCSGGVATAQVSYTPQAGFAGTDSFTYTAADPSGATSSPAAATISVASALFQDGFESGDLTAWSTTGGMVVQSAIVRSGSFAVEANTTNGGTWARKRLAATYTTLSYRIYFRLESKDSTTSPTLLSLRTAAGVPIVGVFVSATRAIGLRNYVTTSSVTSSTQIALGAWRSLELRVTINGTGSSTDVLLDGSSISELQSTTANLGTAPVGELQLGETSSGRTYRVFFDDVLAQST
jgi:Bacterial Ig domain